MEDTPLRQSTSNQNFIGTDIYFHIFSYLSLRSLGTAARACKLWNQIASDDRLWKNLCLTHPRYKFNFQTWNPDISQFSSWRLKLRDVLTIPCALCKKPTFQELSGYGVKLCDYCSRINRRFYGQLGNYGLTSQDMKGRKKKTISRKRKVRAEDYYRGNTDKGRISWTSYDELDVISAAILKHGSLEKAQLMIIKKRIPNPFELKLKKDLKKYGVSLGDAERIDGGEEVLDAFINRSDEIETQKQVQFKYNEDDVFEIESQMGMLVDYLVEHMKLIRKQDLAEALKEAELGKELMKDQESLSFIETGAPTLDRLVGNFQRNNTTKRSRKNTERLTY